MIIRIILKNLYSFKEETEFNMLPGRQAKLNHHKYNIDDLEYLKISSIYGANGAGKSNLIKAISLLQKIVISERIPIDIENTKFKLTESSKDEPTFLAIEFISENKPYIYSISINKGKILEEELSISGKDSKDDKLLFRRTSKSDKDVQIMLYTEFNNTKEKEVLKDVIEKSLMKSDQSLFYLLNELSGDEFIEIKSVFNWFKYSLTVIFPDTKATGLPYLFEKDKIFNKFANENIVAFKTGIENIKTEKYDIEKFFGEDNKNEIGQITSDLQKEPNNYISKIINNERVVFYFENDKIIAAKLVFEHKNNSGNSISFAYAEESDGTKRLLDYLPAFLSVILLKGVYVIDEIERSIHPLLIKELLTKFSLDEKTKGQLIFTTHESNLLDQDILRQDEIWFAEKNKTGSTELYPLSDFKEHHTIDIRKGYLNGRYGAIPFLGNLKDLNWNKYDSEK